MNAPKRLRRRGRRLRDRMLRRGLGVDVRSMSADITRIGEDLPALQVRESETRQQVELVGREVRELAGAVQSANTALTEALDRLGALESSLDGVRGLVESARDNAAGMRQQLRAARELPSYGAAFEDPDPLVTIRIASYRDTEALLGRAVPSALRQTHRNVEIVIVNDGPNPETRAGIEELADPRIRYVEFPFRRSYPDDARRRWMVAGSPGMNEGARLARGAWIAPLDDDDEFTEDHIERLLELARSERAELAYGAFDRVHLATGRHLRIFAYPPVHGGFTFQAAIYHADLRFLDYDEESWRVDEPGDWNLCRRMLLAGVRIAAAEEIVGTMYHVPLRDKPDYAEAPDPA